MAIDWLNSFIIPLIKTTFIIGLFGWLSFIVIRAFVIVWNRSIKHIIKFNILRKPYPEKTVLWIMKCIEEGVGYYDAKKLMMVKMMNKNQINETLYIYDQIINTLNNEKGGESNGRDLKRCNSKTKTATGTDEFPNTE